jgi:hypothetical protein
VTAHSLELPAEAFAGFLVVRSVQQSIDESGDYVRAECQSRRAIAVALTLTSGVLQESRVGEDIRRRPELTEELLGRKQTVASFLVKVAGGTC